MKNPNHAKLLLSNGKVKKHSRDNLKWPLIALSLNSAIIFKLKDALYLEEEEFTKKDRKHIKSSEFEIR